MYLLLYKSYTCLQNLAIMTAFFTRAMPCSFVAHSLILVSADL